MSIWLGFHKSLEITNPAADSLAPSGVLLLGWAEPFGEARETGELGITQVALQLPFLGYIPHSQSIKMNKFDQNFDQNPYNYIIL